MTLEVGPVKVLSDDRLTLHDLRGVDLKVDFFLGTREEFLENTECTAYSIRWRAVDVRVDLITVTERISGLTFYYQIQQLLIDNQVISGDVLSFQTKPIYFGTAAICTIALGRGY